MWLCVATAILTTLFSMWLDHKQMCTELEGRIEKSMTNNNNKIAQKRADKCKENRQQQKKNMFLFHLFISIE